jgi:hypothetical protein
MIDFYYFLKRIFFINGLKKLNINIHGIQKNQ